MREALRQGLEDDNHTVALASDGLEGIHAARKTIIGNKQSLRGLQRSTRVSVPAR
jgi:hypothetical protein